MFSGQAIVGRKTVDHRTCYLARQNVCNKTFLERSYIGFKFIIINASRLFFNEMQWD